MLGREFSLFARVSLLQSSHQCISENGIRWLDRTVFLVGITSFFKHDFILIPWPSRLLKMDNIRSQDDSSKGAEHSEAYFDVGSLKSCRCLRTNLHISLEQPDLTGPDTFVFLVFTHVTFALTTVAIRHVVPRQTRSIERSQ